MSTVWNDDNRFLQSYFSHFKELLYSSLDWAIRDDDGYTFILGRTDDVINVAGHRLGTREIEEAISSHPRVAEAAVIGVKDELKGQGAAGVRHPQAGPDGEDPAPVVAEMMATVTTSLGAWRARRTCTWSTRCPRPVRAAAAALVAGVGRAARPGRPVDAGRPRRAGGDPPRAGPLTCL